MCSGVPSQRDSLSLTNVELTILNESATQKPTKFQGPHLRLAGSTVQSISIALSFHSHQASLTGLQIMIRQHQLGVREAWLRRHCQLVHHLRNLAPSHRHTTSSYLLHADLHTSQIDPIRAGEKPRRGEWARRRGRRRDRGWDKQRCGFTCPLLPIHRSVHLLSSLRERSQARSLSEKSWCTGGGRRGSR